LASSGLRENRSLTLDKDLNLEVSQSSA